MDRKRWLKTNPLPSSIIRFLATAFVVFLTTTLSSRFGLAKDSEGPALELALPNQGTLALWHLLGPFEKERPKDLPLNVSPGEGTVDGVLWRTIIERSGRFDYVGEVALSPGKPQQVFLGTWLRVADPFDGFLLVSVDGSYRLSIDGRLHYQRKIAHRRGRGVEPIRLTLTPGLHRIVFLLERRDNHSYFEAQIRNFSDFSVPTHVTVVPHVSWSFDALLSKLIEVRPSVDETSVPLALVLQLKAEAGAPKVIANVSVDLVTSIGTPPTHWDAGTWDLTASSPSPFEIRLGPIDRLKLEETSEIIVKIGKSTQRLRFFLPQTVQTALENGISLAQSPAMVPSEKDPFDALRATLENHLSNTISAVFKEDKVALARETATLSAYTNTVLSGQSPFLTPGFVEVALRSPYDQLPQSVLVQVPANFDEKSTEKYPLVVALHGYNGSPRRILEAFLDEREPKAKVPGFVIAPDAHGNAFYRGPGEQAVYDALEWAERTYPIDRQRTSITGVSMGGTGTSEIAFRRSDRFSAAAPLCGYHSFLVRRDTANKPLRPWEKHLIHLYSPASWAPSGSDIPLFVAHGTKDFPLENSRVLTNRYRELGFHIEQDWPNLGHSVWTKTYRNAGLFPWLAKWKKDIDPIFVSLTTGQLRLGRKFWLEITAFEHQSELPHVDARAESKQRVFLHTQAVTGICLHETSHLDVTLPLSVVLDDQSLEVPVGQLRCFEKAKGTWQLAPNKIPLENKRAGVEGPLSDLLSLPLVVVYGSKNPNTVALNRYVANRLFSPAYGVTLNIPVVSDVIYARGHFPQRRAVYVGRAEDHLQFSAIANQLPLQTTAEGLRVGSAVFKEPDVGAAFVYRDPERRDGLLGFVTGNGPEGLLRVLSLPQLVPDFVVFDHGLDAAAGEPILGPSAYVRAAGFFENDWSLPSDITDSFASERPR